ncbi:MAG: response regulator [Candidatus Omnitrophica bacterium]|nr:response regulator [Candidatus Omnitrophota bacterium]
MKNKILICDDEEGVRESLKLILSDYYDLIVTETPADCIKVLETTDNIGLVLLDIKMPKINGLDVLRKVKEKDQTLHAIMITGYRSVEAAQVCSELGANSYIIKPFKTQDILDAVKTHFRPD